MSTPLVPDDALVQFYTDGYDESARLARPKSRVEFLRTQELLRGRLPAAPARILDLGGGTGAHAAWLAADGYQVDLVDLVPDHVRLAREMAGRLSEAFAGPSRVTPGSGYMAICSTATVPSTGHGAGAVPAPRPVMAESRHRAIASLESPTESPGGFSALRLDGARHGDRYVIAVAGDLDLSGIPAMQAEVSKAESSDARRIVIDLSAVTFMDSAGMKLLLQAHARSRAEADRLRLVRGPRRVQRVFEMTNTDALLPFLN